MSEIEIPEEPTGIGSIIRVVFKGPADCNVNAFSVEGAITCVRIKGPEDCDYEVLYVGVSPGLWVAYNSEDLDEFTWANMLQIIRYGEAKVFEVVYEGFGAAERNDVAWHHVKGLSEGVEL